MHGFWCCLQCIGTQTYILCSSGSAIVSLHAHAEQKYSEGRIRPLCGKQRDQANPHHTRMEYKKNKNKKKRCQHTANEADNLHLLTLYSPYLFSVIHMYTYIHGCSRTLVFCVIAQRNAGSMIFSAAATRIQV